MTIVLGIESTAHTFGVGIVKNGKILSNVKKSFTTSSGEGGMIPIEVAKHHKKFSQEVYENSLKEAKLFGKEDKIDAIAFSQGPGLAPCLIEGMKFAKALSKKLGKPLVAVNHCVAHLEIGGAVGKKQRKPKDPVLLYVSGANTQVIAYASGKYRVFGETLDVGVGNFIDSFARYTGIGFPGGPQIEKLAGAGGAKYVELPYRVKGMDVAFSGILTNLKQKFDKIGSLHSRISGSEQTSSGSYTLEDLAFSLQETIFAMLVETAERALAHTGKKELLLGGGVACNSRLQDMCRIMCEERGCKFFCPEKSLLVDNGAMIAFLGEIMFKKKIYEKDLDKIDIMPRQRTDEVEVVWK